jgi:5-methylcytosine-specific restriction protein A
VAAAEAKRPSSNDRGYTAAWRAASQKFLADHPYCADGCGGRSEVVDHIIPHRGDMDLFWDQSNWQAMTKAHHDRKTAMQDGGFGNLKHNGVGE